MKTIKQQIEDIQDEHEFLILFCVLTYSEMILYEKELNKKAKEILN